jgi:hypothetical protein
MTINVVLHVLPGNCETRYLAMIPFEVSTAEQTHPA